MSKKWLAPFLLILLTLSGCLYPEDRKLENNIPYQDQLAAVQQAVDNFQKDTGVLPIETKDGNTDIFQKYVIDFNKLVPRYMQEPPGNSYEKGGTFLYVLTNAEKNPTVKLADLVMTNQVQDVQVALKVYMSKHKYPPFKEIVAPGRFTLDFKKLGFKKDPAVKSPFTGNKLPIMMNSDMKFFIDYRKDLKTAIRNNPNDLNKYEDIRYLLADHSFFVPIYSVPYKIENNKPVFLIK